MNDNVIVTVAFQHRARPGRAEAQQRPAEPLIDVVQ